MRTFRKRFLLAIVLLMPCLALAQTVGRTNVPASVSLAWNASAIPDTQVVGYNIYYGPGAGSYTNVVRLGNVLTAVVPLVRGAKYYFAATVIAVGGLESDYSNEVSYTPPSFPPAPVLRLVVTTTTNGITLTWEGQATTSYAVEAADAPGSEWRRLSSVFSSPSGQASYAEPLQTNRVSRFYRVG